MPPRPSNCSTAKRPTVVPLRSVKEEEAGSNCMRGAGFGATGRGTVRLAFAQQRKQKEYRQLSKRISRLPGRPLAGILLRAQEGSNPVGLSFFGWGNPARAEPGKGHSMLRRT